MFKRDYESCEVRATQPANTAPTTIVGNIFEKCATVVKALCYREYKNLATADNLHYHHHT
jgi:hypothetical protein